MAREDGGRRCRATPPAVLVTGERHVVLRDSVTFVMDSLLVHSNMRGEKIKSES